MNINCKLIEGISKNSGNKYLYIEVPVSDTYSIKLFPNNAEQELLREIIKRSTK